MRNVFSVSSFSAFVLITKGYNRPFTLSAHFFKHAILKSLPSLNTDWVILALMQGLGLGVIVIQHVPVLDHHLPEPAPFSHSHHEICCMKNVKNANTLKGNQSASVTLSEWKLGKCKQKTVFTLQEGPCRVSRYKLCTHMSSTSASTGFYLVCVDSKGAESSGEHLTQKPFWQVVHSKVQV